MFTLICEIFIVVIGIMLAVRPSKFVEGMNNKRTAKGEPSFTDSEKEKKVKLYRTVGIAGALIGGIFLVWDIVSGISIAMTK